MLLHSRGRQIRQSQIVGLPQDDPRLGFAYLKHKV